MGACDSIKIAVPVSSQQHWQIQHQTGVGVVNNLGIDLWIMRSVQDLPMSSCDSGDNLENQVEVLTVENTFGIKVAMYD